METTFFNKLKNALKFSENANVEDRRRVLKGAAGLAVVACIPIGLNEGYRLLTEHEQTQFINSVESNQVIENMTFYLDRTAVLKNLENVIIRRCEFIAMPGFIGNSLLYLENVRGFSISDCIMDSRKMAKVGIQVAGEISGAPRLKTFIRSDAHGAWWKA